MYSYLYSYLYLYLYLSAEHYWVTSWVAQPVLFEA